MNEDVLIINGQKIAKGERRHISISVAELYDSTEMTMEVEVIRGKVDGPTLFVCSAIHGDELNGTETIRRILCDPLLNDIKGTLIAVPIVNTFGFNTKSRYMPDRRDLNRCFPGSEEGSLGARLANIFIKEIVQKSSHGIDLHTGAINRTNLPQIRACLSESPEAESMASDFGTSVILNEPLREGSLREYCHSHGIPVLVYEGGEALRFHEGSIVAAVDGIIRTMYGLGMVDHVHTVKPTHSIRLVAGSNWIRCPQSGLLVTSKKLGDAVKQNDLLGVMTDAFGQTKTEIRVPEDGIIIGVTTTPLLNQGDAAYHIAHYD